MIFPQNVKFSQKFRILLVLGFLFTGFAGIAECFELNTILMRSTFKIAGNGSLGTGFILGKPTEKDPKALYYILITAAHILENMKGEEAIIFLRKKSDNSYVKVPFPIQIRDGENQLWVKHPLVDVAVMYVSLPEDIDIALLPTNMLADDEVFRKFEIHPGDELFCLGYPFTAEANPAGFPILRSGKIASFPIVPAKETEYFLYDFEVFNGNSGGPVYFIQILRSYGGVTHAERIQFIAGIISEAFIVKERIKSQFEDKIKKHPLGLAKVIHASFIRETIDLLPSLD